MGRFKDLWDRKKDGDKREQNSFFRVAIIATGLFLLFMFLKKDNIFHWIDAGITIKRQERLIEANDAKIKAMDQRIYVLKTNRDTLETFARENLHFSEPGDDVYLLPTIE